MFPDYYSSVHHTVEKLCCPTAAPSAPRASLLHILRGLRSTPSRADPKAAPTGEKPSDDSRKDIEEHHRHNWDQQRVQCLMTTDGSGQGGQGRGGRGGEDTVISISGNIIAKRQTRWTTRETQIRGRCVLQKENKDVKHGCEMKMAHFVRMNAPPLRVKL